MSYRHWIKQALSAVAFANMTIQLLGRLASFEIGSEFHCWPGVHTAAGIVLGMAANDNGRLILSTGFVLAGLGLKLMLYPMREARECGVGLLMLLAFIAHAGISAEMKANSVAKCPMVTSQTAGFSPKLLQRGHI